MANQQQELSKRFSAFKALSAFKVLLFLHKRLPIPA
jgi:hypothetical protein